MIPAIGCGLKIVIRVIQRTEERTAMSDPKKVSQPTRSIQIKLQSVFFSYYVLQDTVTVLF